jgi:transforming growth factor-beta-induced protein
MKPIRILLMVPLALAMGCTDEPLSPVAMAPEAEAASESRGAVQPKAPAASPTLVEVALAVNAETGEFSTLIAAVLAAGLADELSARGQRTVFAPTDDAFEKLGLDAGNIGSLPTDALQNILLYHVTPGRREAASVVGASRLRMANGGFTQVQVVNGIPYINDARIVGTDVFAENGVIHVIDSVLLP